MGVAACALPTTADARTYHNTRSVAPNVGVVVSRGTHNKVNGYVPRMRNVAMGHGRTVRVVQSGADAPQERTVEMSTLLEMAKSVPAFSRKPGRMTQRQQEELELAIAYVRREVTGPQLAVATHRNPGSISSWVGVRLIRGLRAGIIRVVDANEVR